MNIFSLCNFLFYSYFLFYLFTYLSILSLLNFFSLESQYFAFTLVPPRPVVDRCHIMADLYRWRKYQIMKYPQSTRDDFQVINFIVFTISSSPIFFVFIHFLHLVFFLNFYFDTIIYIFFEVQVPIVPSGPRVSDWCFVGSFESDPPLVREGEREKERGWEREWKREGERERRRKREWER